MRLIKHWFIGRPQMVSTMVLLAAAILPSPVIAQQAPSAFFPAGVIYQQVAHIGVLHAEKMNIPGLDPSKHGTYQSYSYYAFIEDSASGKRYLVSDGRLKAELTLVPNSAGVRPRADEKGVWLVAKYKINLLRSSAELPSFDEAMLSFNDPVCAERACFLVSGTGNFPELPSGTDQLKAYGVARQNPDNTSPATILWGSAFVPRPHYEPLYYLNGCWNVTKLAYLDYQDQACGKALFALPSNDSKNYNLFTGGLALPWGWYYDARIYSSGGTKAIDKLTKQLNDKALEKATLANLILRGAAGKPAPDLTEVDKALADLEKTVRPDPGATKDPSTEPPPDTTANPGDPSGSGEANK